MNRSFLFTILFGIVGNALPLQAQYEGNSPFCRQGGSLIINEISNGPTTGQNNKEYIELLVTPDAGNPLAPVDLSGWILDDNNVAASSEGNAAGHITLGDCYTAVPPGSLLVIYNPGDRNPDLPADDPTDADQDGVYIIPTDHTCVRSCNSNPNTTDESYCPCEDPTGPLTGWQIGLRNAADIFQVRDACETVVHAISWGSLQLSADVRNSPVHFRLNGDTQSDLVIRFTNFVSDDWNDPTNYDNPPVLTGQTPGAPNNPANATFIQQLRSGTFSACNGLIYSCTLTDAGDLTPPAGFEQLPIVLCQGQDIGPFTASYDQPDENLPPATGFNYEYAFLLTGDQAPDFPLLGYSIDGDFDLSTLAPGTYRIWGFSYIQTGGGATVEQFLDNSVASVADIEAFFACGYDGDLDSLDRNGLVVEIQIITSPSAVTPDLPLTACGSQGTATFNLRSLDQTIQGGSNLPVVWYTDASASQVITNPTAYTATASQVFARLESSGCSSQLTPVQLAVGEDLNLMIEQVQAPDCDMPLGTISLNINDPAGYTINWTGTEWDGSTVLTGLAPGTYSVTVTDPVGCRDSASIRLNPSGVTIAEFQTTNPTCAQPSGGVIRLVQILGGNGPYQVAFDGGSFRAAAGWSESGLEAGNYTIIIKDGAGCENAQTVSLAAPAGLILNLGPDLELEAGDSVLIVPSGNFSPTAINVAPQAGISLSPAGILLKPIETTTYTVTAATSEGCTVSDQLTVTVIPPDEEEPPLPDQKIFIPNAFSPNEDGVNDTFTVFAEEEVINIKSMRIFDRWGNLLLENENIAPNDTQQGWRGDLRGQMLPMGVYIYFIELDFADGHTEIVKGEIALVR